MTVRLSLVKSSQSNPCFSVKNARLSNFCKNISVLDWWSLLQAAIYISVLIYLVEENGVPGENHRRPASHRQPLSHNVVHLTLSRFEQYFSYIVVVSVIGGGNRSTRRKPQSCRKSLKNFIIMLYRVHLIIIFLFFISESVENAFTDPAGEFDYVINLAAETKYGQTEPVC